MTEKEIAAIIGKDRVLAGHLIVCSNVNHLLFGQQDVISVNKRGLVIEYEIKISRKDFQREAKKGRATRFENPDMYQDGIANQLYYVVPIGMIEADEVPAWAGLMYITDKGIMYSKKTAPIVHTFKHDLAPIFKKITTLYQQRHFLGGCLLTYKNRQARERFERRQSNE